MYADSVTPSMKVAITETQRRREIQNKYNVEHGIVPKTIDKKEGTLLNTWQAKCWVRKAAQRQEQVADKEILEVQHCTAKHGKAIPGPEVIPQHAGHGQQDDEEQVDQTGLFTSAAGQLHAAADDVAIRNGTKC